MLAKYLNRSYKFHTRNYKLKKGGPGGPGSPLKLTSELIPSTSRHFQIVVFVI